MKSKTKAEPAPTPEEQTKLDAKALLGGMLCGLCLVADVKDVREAVQWWSRNHNAWINLAALAARDKVNLATSTNQAAG